MSKECPTSTRNAELARLVVSCRSRGGELHNVGGDSQITRNMARSGYKSPASSPSENKAVNSQTRFGPNRVAADMEEREDLIFW